MTAARLALDLILSPVGVFAAIGLGVLGAAAVLERWRP